MHFHDCSFDSSPRDRLLHIARHVSFAIVIAAAVFMLFGTIVLHLWNAVMPQLFGVGHLDFWRAVGLLLLARILVGGFHHGGFARRHPFGRRDAWRQYEDWWREVGRQSFRDYSSTPPTEEKQA